LVPAPLASTAKSIEYPLAWLRLYER
jgi:hypothetical protein